MLMPHYPPRCRGVARTGCSHPPDQLSCTRPAAAAQALATLGEAGAPATAGLPPLPHPSINNPGKFAQVQRTAGASQVTS